MHVLFKRQVWRMVQLYQILTASKDIIVASGILWLNETARLLKKKILIKEKTWTLSLFESVEVPFWDHLSLHWKVVLLAHLQFHTQLQQECQLLTIFPRGIWARQLETLKTPHYAISISVSLLHPYLLISVSSSVFRMPEAASTTHNPLTTSEVLPMPTSSVWKLF